MKRALFLPILFVLWAQQFKAWAQEPRLAFLEDSTEIGNILHVSLAFDHLPEAEVFFPQTSADFSPFKLSNKNVYPTRTQKNMSTDSVIYNLKVFKTDSLLRLSLPVWVIHEGDSIHYSSNVDSIWVKQFVSEEELANKTLKSASELIHLRTPDQSANWQLYIFATFLGILLLFVLSRKKIEQLIKQYRFRKVHRDFRNEFRRWMKEDVSREQLEEVNKSWRKHVEWLEQKPYTSYSVAEIEKINNNKIVSEALREIEATLYGGQPSQRLQFALQVLYAFATDRFKERYWQFKKQLKTKTK
ncbi:hypothetical protein LAG90_12150 [Marinilongibacter aquaticus]|uniref:hypothetical protein n=1 Tax=Marinilongibacter aquaticus TaxID=2975157 RepID=UPI0021BD3D06|nr:hypothetical protein [Marinilongibacter aquaticus]UBM57570.1 hypothetical protein LAG90_12150 [Marinilongibacter aquaticus]